MLELDRIYTMDCIAGLKQLDDNSIDCVVTSPPYWGLRDYGTARWEGGDSNCNHQRDNKITNECSTGQKSVVGGIGDAIYKDVCKKCGAVRIDKQFGLEKTPEEYVNRMVDVFREVKRVLKKEGTVWLNLGDSYAGSGKGIGSEPDPKWDKARNDENKHKTNWKELSLKPKDLVGIPWRVAFALQADGWWLRQDIIWSKPNPMPESVTDRCTKSHEYVFLLTKSKDYYYDAEAIKEKGTESFNAGYQRDTRITHGTGGGNTGINAAKDRLREECAKNGFITRNKRSVWTITTKPFSGAHFATFPPDLIEPMIKAGTSEKGVCPDCGKPWIRITENQRSFESGSGKSGNPINGKQSPVQGSGYGDVRLGPCIQSKTLSWQPSCNCNKEPIPSVVLDPFMGSGTTGLVARKLLRHFIGFDLNPEYCKIAEKRLVGIPQRLEVFC